MGLESATFISGLNASNPINATDNVGEGDDHLRLIKSTLLNTFPNITGAVTLTHTQINDAARLSASNTFTGTTTFEQTVTFSRTQPRLILDETDASSDERLWDIQANAGGMRIRTRTDADASGNDIFVVERTATVVDSIQAHAPFRVYNSGGTDFIGISHNGSDANMDFTNTTELNINDVGRVFIAANGGSSLQFRTDVSGFAIIRPNGDTSADLLFDVSADAWQCDVDFTVIGALTAASYGGITESNLLDKSAAETISGAYTFSADLTLGGELIANSGGSQSDPQIRFDNSTSTGLYSSSAAEISIACAGDRQVLLTDGLVTFDEAVEISGALTVDGVLTTPDLDAAEVGYKGAPHNEQNGDYTLVLSDAGKRIYKASGGAGETITIPANSSVAFPVGTIVEIINDGGGDLSIAITTDTLEELGTGNTGTRTLPDNNKAVIEKVTSTLWKYQASV